MFVRIYSETQTDRQLRFNVYIYIYKYVIVYIVQLPYLYYGNIVYCAVLRLQKYMSGSLGDLANAILFINYNISFIEKSTSLGIC